MNLTETLSPMSYPATSRCDKKAMSHPACDEKAMSHPVQAGVTKKPCHTLLQAGVTKKLCHTLLYAGVT